MLKQMTDRRKICKWFEVCPLKRFYHERKLHQEWLEKYCWGDFLKCARYQMEENGIYHPDNMLPDGTVEKDLK